MNLLFANGMFTADRIPRVSGGEPSNLDSGYFKIKYSPRERG